MPNPDVDMSDDGFDDGLLAYDILRAPGLRDKQDPRLGSSLIQIISLRSVLYALTEPEDA